MGRGAAIIGTSSGGGGHGLATAHHLAKNHGLTRVAVLGRGLAAEGNVGRNATIVRANCLQAITCTAMFPQRGLLNLFHTDGRRDAFARRGNRMRRQGDDAPDRRSCGAAPLPGRPGRGA